MNNLRLVLIGLLIPCYPDDTIQYFFFLHGLCNKNPDPALVTVDFNGITFNAIEGKKDFLSSTSVWGAIPLLGTAPTSDQTYQCL